MLYGNRDKARGLYTWSPIRTKRRALASSRVGMVCLQAKNVVEGISPS